MCVIGWAFLPDRRDAAMGAPYEEFCQAESLAYVVSPERFLATAAVSRFVDLVSAIA